MHNFDNFFNDLIFRISNRIFIKTKFVKNNDTIYPNSSLFNIFIHIDNLAPTLLTLIWINNPIFKTHGLKLIRDNSPDNLISFGFNDITYNPSILSPLRGKDFFIFFDKSSITAYSISSKSNFFPMLKKAIALGFLSAAFETSFLNLHGCAIKFHNRCIVFPAKSGGGKSTLCQNAIKEGFSVLSDERVLIEYHKTYNVYPTPFGEIQHLKSSMPLSTIVLLRHSENISIVKYSYFKAFLASFYEEYFYRYFFLNRDFTENLYDNLMHLFKNIPIYALYLNKNFNNWDLLEKLLI